MRLIPIWMKRPLKRLLEKEVRQAMPPLDSNRILSSLYFPALVVGESGQDRLSWNRRRVPARSASDPLPVPPPELRMGYATDSDEQYLSWGLRTAASLKSALERHHLDPAGRAPLLDWGCASGRVLRHFGDEAQTVEVWGADVDAGHIAWAKENLSPPLRFVTCTAYPHLPFEDAAFGLVYGISVFTHLYQLLDTWLMEIRRILAPGACALFTVHDEHAWRWLRDNWARSPFWQAFLSQAEVSKGLSDDLYVVRRGEDWNQTQVFFRTEWIRQEWSRYLDVVAIEPFFEGYQSLVVLRKPGLRKGSWA